MEKQNEVQFLAEQFSKHFHHHSLTPDFILNDIRGQAGSVWDIFPTDEPVKRIREFLPNSRLPPRMKRRIYFKAERAKQHLVCSEILGHYIFTRLGEIHYQSRSLVKEVGIQWLTVTGHRNPYDEEMEEYFLKNKQSISLLYLKLENGQELWIDLCSPQVDVHSYTKEDFPCLILTELPKTKGELYSKKHNNFVALTEDAPPAEMITSEEHYGQYLEMIVDQAEKENDYDRAEYLVEYHERMEEDFSKQIKGE